MTGVFQFYETYCAGVFSACAHCTHSIQGTYTQGNTYRLLLAKKAVLPGRFAPRKYLMAK